MDLEGYLTFCCYLLPNITDNMALVSSAHSNVAHGQIFGSVQGATSSNAINELAAGLKANNSASLPSSAATNGVLPAHLNVINSYNCLRMD